MKAILLKILKVFLILAAVVLALLMVFGVVLILGWPWWVGLFILLGFFGIFLGFVFVRKVLLRKRERNFVQQVIEQDDAYNQSMGERDKERSKELQDRWKEAMGALRKSHLKKMGNPLYVLPWYLIIGESASGKTTAIKSARLSSPFAELSRTSGISGTRNCDWWFFEQAILLDTAGRYAIPVDEGRDKDEWQKFLSLLIKFRKKEPINGLVVTIAADKLLDGRMEELEDDGRNIRRRIDELMRVLGAKFPIYLLVTKCDLIQGMTQFGDNLPEKALDQAMGYINQEMSKDVLAFHDRAVQTIGERLRDIRLLIFQRSESKIDPELLLFPEEFEKVRPGLDAFIKAAFQENPYQETPILRGIFYSSGRQEGTPYSHFLSSLGLIEEREVLPGTNKGLFLKDFFSKILPRDRGLFRPTQRTLQWGRLTRNLGLTSWVAIALAICGLLSFSFVKNLSTLRDAGKWFSPPPVLQGEILTDVVTMDRFRQAVLDVEERNKNWWIPRFGLNESIEVEYKLKDKYCSQFRDGFLVSFDKQMSDRMTNFTGMTPDAVIGQHVAHLVRRINLLRERLEGGDFEKLLEMPQPSFDTIVVAANARILPELRERFHGLYLYNLIWREDSSRLNQEMNTLQSWLKHMLNLRPNDIHWLVAWMNTEPELADVTLEQFWGGSKPVMARLPETEETADSSKSLEEPSEQLFEPAAEIMVSRGFTVDGKEGIESFIREMEAALPEPIILAGRKTDFESWYKDAYLQAWYDFGENFPKGKTRLADKTQWQQVGAIMATDQGPYLALLDTMADQLDPFGSLIGADSSLPSWVTLIYEFQEVKTQARQKGGGLGQLKDAGIIRRATTKVKSKLTRLKRETGMKTVPGELIQSRMIAAKAFEQYEKALLEVSPVISSRRVAFQMTASVFGEDPTSGSSAFFMAQNATQALKGAMASKPPEQPMFWNLVRGPWDFFWEYACEETACQIRTLWEEKVLVEVQGVSDITTKVQLLLGEDGYARKFIKGPIEPYLGRNLQKGYYAKEALGQKMPFESAFLNFITKGAIAIKPQVAEEPESSTPALSNHDVTIKGSPTDTNPEARIKPHATNLELKCANESTQMVNMNFPVRKTFNWSSDSCQEVNFSIEVGNLVLTRKYTGEDAFPRFLRDFKGGQRTFRPSEFPNQAPDLERLGITYIKVNYEFRGAEPVMGFVKKRKRRTRAVARVPSLPRNIVSCWDQ